MSCFLPSYADTLIHTYLLRALFLEVGAHWWLPLHAGSKGEAGRRGEAGSGGEQVAVIR
jgi:hypothetical protein